MSAEGNAAPPFTARTVAWLIAAGAIAFVGLLVLGAYAPDLRAGNNGGAHALSTSATGFKGIGDLIGYAGGTPTRLRDEHALGTEDLLILTPDIGTSPDEIMKRVTPRYAKPTLIILPKWMSAPLPGHPGWVQTIGPWDPKIPATLLAKIGKLTVRQDKDGGTLTPANGLTAAAHFPAPATVQSISGAGVTPLLMDAKGRAVLAQVNGNKLYVLADPDLLDNMGLANPLTARAALAMLDDLNATGSQSVSFDLTLNGFAKSPSLLKLAFSPPFLALTIAILGAALLAGLHGTFRFGPAAREERAIGFGKAALVDNAAGLIRLARREHRTGARYALLVRDAVADATGAPSQIGDEALAAYLDRLGDGRAGRYTDLARAAIHAQDREDLIGAARALYRWKKEVTGEG